MKNIKIPLSEGLLQDLWNVVVKVMNNDKGVMMVIFATLAAIQYVGPGPLIMLTSLIEMGMSGTYLDGILNKYLKKNITDKTILAYASGIVGKALKDSSVKSQINRIKKLSKDLLTMTIKSKDDIFNKASNLKIELKKCEQILSNAIDSLMQSYSIKAKGYTHHTLKQIIMNALSLTRNEILSLHKKVS